MLSLQTTELAYKFPTFKIHQLPFQCSKSLRNQEPQLIQILSSHHPTRLFVRSTDYEESPAPDSGIPAYL